MSLPKISVIVAIYNVAPYLYRSLESLISQSLDDIEIICVNDGSTDNSSDILQQYAQRDTRVRIINHKRNKKLFHARQTGFQCAKGKYIACVDPDDQIDLETLEFCYNKLESVNADALAFGIRYKDLDGNIREHCKPEDKIFIQNSDYTPVDVLLDYLISPSLCNKIYRASLISKVDFSLFTEEFTYNEDVVANVLLLSSCNILICISNIFYTYIARESSVSNFVNSEKKYIESFNCMTIGHKVLFQYIEKYPYLNNCKEKIIRYLLPEISYRFESSFISEMSELIIRNSIINYIDACPEISACLLFNSFESKIWIEKKLSDIQEDRWYRFGQLSRKRKIWAIINVLSKKFKLYWLFKNPFVGFIIDIFKA